MVFFFDFECMSGAESYAKVQDVSGVNHINIESQQDKSRSSEESSSWQVGANFSPTTGGSYNGAVSKSSGSGQSQQTNSVSRLVGSEDI